MKNQVLLFIVWVVIAILSITIANGQIISTTVGGDWDDPLTWIGGVVPDQYDNVIIDGNVDVTPGAECLNITINPGDTLSGGQGLQVFGDITNNGVTYGGLYLYIEGDITNNGIWENYSTSLQGSGKQYITLQSGKRFDGRFTVYNNTDTIVAASYLYFTKEFSLNNHILNLDYHYIRFRGPNTWFGQGTIVSPGEFYGTISFYSTTYIIGDLVVMDTLQNRNTNDSQINIEGNFTNNGIIQDNVHHLYLRVTGNIANNGIWQNYYSELNGSGPQVINLQAGKRFDSDFGVTNSTDTIITITDLHFTKDFNLYTHILNLNNFNIRFTGTDSNFGNGTIVSPKEFLGTISINGSTYIEGDLINSDTLQNRTGGNYSLYVNGDFTNNGVVQDNTPNRLLLYLSGNVTNNGVWANYQTTLNGTEQQLINLVESKIFGGRFYNYNNNDTVKAISNLVFTSSLSLGNRYLDMNDYNLRFIGPDTEIGTGTIFYPNELQGTFNFTNTTYITGNPVVSDTFQNKSNHTAYVHIDGHITNNGIVRDNTSQRLYLYAQGDITNDGQWDNYITYLNGTDQQRISLLPGKSFDGEFRIQNTTDTIVALSDLHFTNILNFENNILNLNNHNLWLSGSESYMANGTIISPNEFRGEINMYYNFNIEGDLVVTDTIQNRDSYDCNVHLNGSLLNNGVIQNNTRDNLLLYITGNITNNGTWQNYQTRLNGTADQTISLMWDQPISGEVIFESNYGNTPYQWYYNESVLDSPDFNGETSADLTWLVPVSDVWNGTFYCQTGAGNSRNIVVEGIEEDSYALQFDGTDDYVNCGQDASLNLTSTLSFEAWIYPTGWGELADYGYGRILDKHRYKLFLNNDNSSGYNTHSLVFIMHSSDISYSMVTPPNSIELNAWQHIVATYNGSGEVHIYINGVEQPFDGDPPSGSLNDNSSDDLFIGESNDQQRAFEGMMDEIRIWNIVRSKAEIQANLMEYLEGNEAGLVACWRMNEGSGQIVYDLSATGNDGQLGSTSSADDQDPTWISSDWPYDVRFTLDLKAFLEGPFNGTDLNIDLNNLDLIPTNQPYNTPPWNYSGDESADPIPANVVDWVLIDLRDATDAGSAKPGTNFGQQAAFLLNDGRIVNPDGISKLQFTQFLDHDLFVNIDHRNHVFVLSADPADISGPEFSFDFTTGADQAYGTDAQVDLGNNVYGLKGGDASADSLVDLTDKAIWAGQAGNHGYLSADFNLDGQVNNPDKNNVWFNIEEPALQVPAVTTASITDISQTAATGGGDVTNSGGATVTVRGICWSTNTNPTLADDFTTDGSGTGVFTSSLTGLSPNTEYFVRAYATNNEGTAYGNEVSFTTLQTINQPTVTSASITDIAQTTATGGGEVTDDGGATVTARGVCWSTSTNPTLADNFTTDGSGTGSFISSLTGLSPNTEYFVRAYASNSEGTAYGNEVNFTTSQTINPPTVTTAAITDITQTTATGGGEVTDDGGATVTARGICWSISTNPTLADNFTTDGSGTGVFTSSLTGLSLGTEYFVRAYATNGEGTVYGNEVSFTTSQTINLPTVTTAAITDITQTSATGGGEVTNNGGATVTARGICWSTSTNPTLADDFTTDGSGTGSYISSLTGLSPNTDYFVRAYATNSEGTAYGNEVGFTTMQAVALPTVTTTNVFSITQTSATGGGWVSNQGGAPVTSRGVCWSLNPDPTLSGNFINEGSGTGFYFCSITGLSPGTTYYVRAYATNSGGTAYGNNEQFNTLPIYEPTVYTISITDITQTSATGGGEVTDDGGAAVTARGVCWSLSSGPALADDYTTDGSGTGEYTSFLTDLNPETEYFVRAYATNSAGTTYGNEVNFMTLEPVTPPTVTTAAITDILQSTATSGGEVTDNGGATVTARGVCWSISSNPTLADDYTTDGSGTGTFNSSLTGLIPDSEYFVRAYATNDQGTAYGNEINFMSSGPCPGTPTMTDDDGNVYNTIQIGTQCWMAENLNVGIMIDASNGGTNEDGEQTDNGTIEKWCFDNIPGNCDEYGGLYQWDEMMGYVTSEGAKGICPDGWHVPTDMEWTILTDYLGGEDVAGGKMKETGIDHWNSPNTGATNASGFTALGGGSKSGSQFFDLTFFTLFRTSTEITGIPINAWYRALFSYSEDVSRNNTHKVTGQSVRCLKDE